MLLRRGLAVMLAAVLGATGVSSGASAQPSDSTLSSDSFEGSYAGWTPVTAANGSVELATGEGYGGGTALRMTTPDDSSGSISYVRRTLPEPVYGLAASGRFNVQSGGCDDTAGYSSGSVPFFRFFDPDLKRVVGLVRINGSCSKTAKLYVQYGGSYYRTGKNISFGSWNTLELRAVVGTPGASLVQVFMNGQKAYETTIADNGRSPFASVTMHNEHVNQVGDLLADDVSLAAVDAPPPPSNPCDETAAAPTNDFPGQTVLADGFESGGFEAWSAVAREGDATALVTETAAYTPRCGARLHVTSASGSRANLSKTHPVAARDVYFDGRFRVVAEGASGSNVPFIRLFAGDVRVADFYRTNGGGQLYLRTTTASGSVAYTSLGRLMALDSWQRMRVHVVLAGDASKVQFWLEDSLVFDRTLSLWDHAITRSMVGSEHFAQQMDLDVDDVVIKQDP